MRGMTTPPQTLAVTFDDVQRAAERIADHAHRTPLLTSATADQISGGQLHFKAENLQRMGAFKFRGGFNALAMLSDAERQPGVIAYSSGNHAQAVALAARIQGAPATIVMPDDAPRVKLDATRGYGAEIVTYGRGGEEGREEIARRLSEERGLTVIPPYDHAAVISGQGTAALEALQDLGDVDVVIAPLGGGGLLSGTAVVAQALCPGAEVYGVEPEAGNDGQQSLREGRIIRIEDPQTIADGARTSFLGDLTFPILRQTVTDVVTMTDAELVTQMEFFASRMKTIVEPTGCLAAAAAMTGRIDVRGKRALIIISGGNVDLNRFAELVGSGPRRG